MQMKDKVVKPKKNKINFQKQMKLLTEKVGVKTGRPFS